MCTYNILFLEFHKYFWYFEHKSFHEYVQNSLPFHIFKKSQFSSERRIQLYCTDMAKCLSTLWLLAIKQIQSSALFISQKDKNKTCWEHYSTHLPQMQTFCYIFKTSKWLWQIMFEIYNSTYSKLISFTLIFLLDINRKILNYVSKVGNLHRKEKMNGLLFK